LELAPSEHRSRRLSAISYPPKATRLGAVAGCAHTGIAGVDIYRMDADGKAVEHWDVLQFAGDPKNSAPWVAPNLPRANPNGMF
jgi:hypothetical protein